MKGTTVQLAVTTIIGTDPFGAPIEKEEFVDVPDVLVGNPSSDDIITSTQLYSKSIIFVLGIPKGDTHDWVDKKVIIWGKPYKTFGYPMTGEQANIPLRWGSTIKVERYG